VRTRPDLTLACPTKRCAAACVPESRAWIPGIANTSGAAIGFSDGLRESRIPNLADPWVGDGASDFLGAHGCAPVCLAAGGGIDPIIPGCVTFAIGHGVSPCALKVKMIDVTS
jgi:hypothetical protein